MRTCFVHLTTEIPYQKHSRSAERNVAKTLLVIQHGGLQIGYASFSLIQPCKPSSSVIHPWSPLSRPIFINFNNTTCHAPRRFTDCLGVRLIGHSRPVSVVQKTGSWTPLQPPAIITLLGTIHSPVNCSKTDQEWRCSVERITQRSELVPAEAAWKRAERLNYTGTHLNWTEYYALLTELCRYKALLRYV